MFLFQVFMHRVVTPDEGQQMLEQIIQKIDRESQGTSGVGTVKIPGVTVYENPFSESLQQLFEELGLVYNHLNYCYQKALTTEREAASTLAWFENSVRPWLRSVYKENNAFVDRLQARVQDEHDDVRQLDSF